MDNNKASLKEWIHHLSRHYSVTTIRRLFFKHKGSTAEFSKILVKKTLERSPNNIKERAIERRYSQDDAPQRRESKKEEAYRKEQEEKGRLVIFPFNDEAKFNKFFREEVYLYFTDKSIEKSIFCKLELILKDYFYEYRKIEKLEKFIKQDSIKEREEKIKKILEQANEILAILESDLYNKIPTEIKIKTIGELNKSTEEKLKELNLVPTYSYSQLLQSLRNI